MFQSGVGGVYATAPGCELLPAGVLHPKPAAVQAAEGRVSVFSQTLLLCEPLTFRNVSQQVSQGETVPFHRQKSKAIVP